MNKRFRTLKRACIMSRTGCRTRRKHTDALEILRMFRNILRLAGRQKNVSRTMEAERNSRD